MRETGSSYLRRCKGWRRSGGQRVAQTTVQGWWGAGWKRRQCWVHQYSKQLNRFLSAFQPLLVTACSLMVAFRLRTVCSLMVVFRLQIHGAVFLEDFLEALPPAPSHPPTHTHRKGGRKEEGEVL